MSRAYDLHQNGDCDTFCGVCQWEDAQDPDPAACSCGTPGLDYEGPQEDCPIHGSIGWCGTCGAHRGVIDEFDDQIGYEEKARPVRVVALDCGHDIVTELKR